MTHLWEIKHPYYCSETNYRCAGNRNHEVCFPYDSWEDFYAAWGDSDLDMNLVFRWDWKKADPAEDEEDRWPRRDTLYIFFMMQRKGDYRWCEISIKDEDEDNVRKFLSQRWNHLKLLWEGIAE